MYLALAAKYVVGLIFFFLCSMVYSDSYYMASLATSRDKDRTIDNVILSNDAAIKGFRAITHFSADFCHKGCTYQLSIQCYRIDHDL